MKLKRCDNFNLDFQTLVAELDAELAIRDGEDHAFYHQYNGIDHLNNVVVAYENGHALACGAFKKRSETRVEVKRMFTSDKRTQARFCATSTCRIRAMGSRTKLC